MTTVEETLTSGKGAARRRMPVLSEGKFGALSSQANGLLLALYAISVTWPIKFQLGPLYITFSRIMLLALLVPMILRILSGRYGGIKPPDILVMVFGLWAYVCMGVNHGFISSIESSGMFFVETVGAYYFGRVFLRSLQDFYVFVRYMIISLLISVPFGTVEMFTGEPLMLDLLRQVNPLPGIFVFAPTIDYEPRLGLHRVQYTLQHPIFYGIMCASFVAVCFKVMTRGESLSKQIFWGAVVIYTTFMGLSSAGWLSALMQIGFVVYERFTRWFKPRWKIIALGFLTFYILLSLASTKDPITYLATKFTLNSHTAWIRIHIYDYGWDNVVANPIFGLGMNDWLRPHWLLASVDSLWLLTAMRFGLPGAIFLSLTILIPIFAVGRAKTKQGSDLNAFQIGYMCCMISWIVSLATVTISVEVFSLFMTVAAGGYWIADQARAEAGDNLDPRDRRKRGTRAAQTGAGQKSDKTSRRQERINAPERMSRTGTGGTQRNQASGRQASGRRRTVPRRDR